MIVSGVVFLFWIAWIGCIGYILIISFAIYHWLHSNKIKALDDNTVKPCSILIPFRNEKENLPGLLSSLDALETGNAVLEIIFIDDHSDDGGSDVIKLSQKSNYWIVQSDGFGKKAAISKGISIAKYDTVLQLDADVTFSPHWFISVHNKLQTGIGFLTGMVSIKNPNGWLEHFQLFDLIAMMGMTNAGIKSTFWNMANGANMAYPRRLYDQISNPAHTRFSSGDDMFLIEEANKQNLPIDFNKDTDGLVYTRPEKTVQFLIRQRLRWASKNHALQSQMLKGVLLFVLLFNISLIILPLLNVFFFLFWFIKVLVDFIYLKWLSRDFKTRINWLYYPASALLFPFFIGYISFLYLIRFPFDWKGR